MQKQPDNRGTYYDDGYGSYPNNPPNPYDIHPSPSPNGYEHEHQTYQPIHPDPFAIPSQSVYNSPPMHVMSPPMGEYHPQQMEYHNPYQAHLSPPMHALSPPPQIQPSPTPSPYSLNDQPYSFNENEADDQDTGDIPLLRRDNPSMPLPIPGAYDEPTDDDRSESNIRYGRIPQRVPRRYKTIKKVP